MEIDFIFVFLMKSIISDRDDSPEEIAVAEVYEETGYKVSITDLVSYIDLIDI